MWVAFHCVGFGFGLIPACGTTNLQHPLRLIHRHCRWISRGATDRTMGDSLTPKVKLSGSRHAPGLPPGRKIHRHCRWYHRHPGTLSGRPGGIGTTTPAATIAPACNRLRVAAIVPRDIIRLHRWEPHRARQNKSRWSDCYRRRFANSGPSTAYQKRHR